MSVVEMLWVVLAAGFAAVCVAAAAVWRQRMRESLPAPSVVRHFVNVGEKPHDHAADRRLPAASPRRPRAA